jgi:hypothetical protein
MIFAACKKTLEVQPNDYIEFAVNILMENDVDEFMEIHSNERLEYF